MRIFAEINLEWSLIAVGFASFFAGLADYLSRYSQERQLPEL